MFARRIVLGILASTLAACGTVKGDVEVICNMQTECPRLDTPDKSETARQQAVCLEGKIKTSDGKQIIAAMSMVAPEDRPRLLREAAREHGLASCPEADALEERLRAK